MAGHLRDLMGTGIVWEEMTKGNLGWSFRKGIGKLRKLSIPR